MSRRYQDYDKGSSRSTRDDSRAVKDRHSVGRGYEKWERQRARSRSPRRRDSPPASSSAHSHHSSRHSPDKSTKQDTHHKEEKKEYYSKWENSDSEEEVPAPPPPPRISKIIMGFTKPKVPIKMSLGGPSKTKPALPKPTVASVFNADDDDDEPEEMPAEAKMRMRNIGRETPTSAGPNSFGKTKQGFCDSKKVFEKSLKEALDTAEKAPKTMMKFPQTIYRINGP